MEHKRRPWTEVTNYYLRATWPILLAAITTFLPMAGYTRSAILLVCCLSFAFVSYRFYKAEKNRQFSKVLRRSVWLISTLLILVGGIRLNKAATLAEQESHAKMVRAEFLMQLQRRVTFVKFTVELNRGYTPNELGPFRILLKLVDLRLTPNDKHPSLWFAAVDEGHLAHEQRNTMLDMTSWVWSQDPDAGLGDMEFVAGWPATHLSVDGPLAGSGPFPRLDDYDKLSAIIFVTEPLVSKISYIDLQVDEYVLLHLPISLFREVKRDPYFGGPNGKHTWVLSPEQKKVIWVELANRSCNDGESPIEIDYSRYTPIKASEVNDVVSVPPLTEVWPKGSPFPF